MCARIYKIFMNRQKTLFLLFMFEIGEIWIGICRGIKRSREIFFLVLSCSVLWLKNKRGDVANHASPLFMWFMSLTDFYFLINFMALSVLPIVILTI